MWKVVRGSASRSCHVVSCMFSVGQMLDEGVGCEQNYFSAAGWYCHAASKGHLDAKVSLGCLLTYGLGVVSRDREQAIALFREAIEGGSIRALWEMGINYSFGHGVEENLATALSYWHRAADQGHAEGARRTGFAYWKGMGGFEKNTRLAVKYLKVSAAQGDEYAIAHLKKMTACAQCGTGSAPRVCAGCKKVHYCNRECQLLHWRDPSDPHMSHCGIRRHDTSSVSNQSPSAEKTKSTCPCAACGAHDAKMLCSDCLYEGDPKRRVRQGLPS